MVTTEIKIDPSTLPEDGQWCEYEDYEREQIIGTFSKEENGFFEYGRRLPQSAFEIHFWKPLEIEWSFRSWISQNERRAELEGCDKYGNDFLAIGTCETTVSECDNHNLWTNIDDIEWIGASSRVASNAT